MVLRAYENFFVWVASVALVFYVLFLLDCRRFGKGKVPSLPRLFLAILTGGLAAGLNDGYSYLVKQFHSITFSELLYYYNNGIDIFIIPPLVSFPNVIRMWSV